MDDPIGIMPDESGILRGQHNGRSFSVKVSKDLHDIEGRLGIQISRGFIGENEGG
jgi:hypothetical protein